ncbi:unnamed protein product, partial [marine sediment metagenome]
NGTILGANWTTQGRFSSALSFNGNGDEVTVPYAPSLDLTAGMTLEAWVYPTDYSDWRIVLFQEFAGSWNYYLALYDGSVVVGLPESEFESASVNLNEWSHLAATYDGLNLRIFINGSEVGSLDIPGVVLASQRPVTIGSSISGEYFSGRIDEIRIYDRALTATEIQADMNTPL